MGSATGKNGKFRRTAGGAMVRTVPRKPVDASKPVGDRKAPELKTRIDGTDMVYYWAYGSNLCKQQMRARCPRSKEAGMFNVHGVRLVFRGVADVTADPNGFTPGALYKISRTCLATLDAFEGVNSGLYVKRYFKIHRDGQDYKCLFYQMAIDTGVVPPGADYLAKIAQGYVDFGLDMDYLDIAVQESWDNKLMTPFLRHRQWKRGETRMVKNLYDLWGEEA